MKPPKNFYSNLDRRKQGLDGIPDIPVPSSEDAGKVIKVGEDGDYELGESTGNDSRLPDILPASNGAVVQITGNQFAYRITQINRVVTRNAAGVITSASQIGAKVVISDGTIIRTYLATEGLQNSAFINQVQISDNIQVTIDNVSYGGTVIGKTASTIIASIHDANGINYIFEVGDSYTISRLGTVRYVEITSSGSSVSLPSGVTFADVYADLQAGVDVKFTSGARVYSVTSFESTNIRAHWISDMDLTSIEVYVINLASDGTGTVASATFSGS